MADPIDSFVATLDEMLRFLDSYKDSLFYVDINPGTPPAGARQFEITTFAPSVAARVISEAHPGPGVPRLTPGAKTMIDAAAPPFAVGMNIQPKGGFGLPQADPNIAKFDWVRFPMVAYPGAFPQPTLDAAFAFYDPIISAYHRAGNKILLVLTAELYGAGSHYNLGNMSAVQWVSYSQDYARVLEQVVRRYSTQIHGYEIWNEGDVQPGNPSAIAFPPRDFAPFLDKMAQIIKAYAPQAKTVLGGLVTGADNGVKYLREVKAVLGGRLPVDAVGIHAYGKGAPLDDTVFSQLGNIADDIRILKQEVPNHPLWLTEMGALGANTPEYGVIASQYARNLYTYIRQEHAKDVPVVIWYAWSDAMDAASRTNGLIAVDGQKKPLYDVFFGELLRKT